MKEVELFDIWEHFNIKFIIIHPLKDDYYKLRINGSIEELGNWNSGSGPINMKLSKYKMNLFNSKYGENLKPWEISIQVKN